ncbi:MAG: hypothetical protein HY718_00860 [Planctomycetes bacterium]|nr:hypothetical protein [Planctomycetota bacterium]
MAKFSLRRFDTQAQASVLLSLLSVVSLAALAFFVMGRMSFSEFTPYYGGNRRMAILGAGVVTLLLSGAGFGFGLNSAGQRRNDKQQLSWLGFFVGAIVLALALVMLVLFAVRGEAVIQ